MEAMISIPESLYLRLVDYFDDRSDADGNSEGFTPNEEMKLLSELEKCDKNISTPKHSSIISYFDINVNKSCLNGLSEEEKIFFQSIVVKQLKLGTKIKISYSDIIQYKNFIGSVQFSSEDNVFHGKIIGIDDLVTFEGLSIKELRVSFKEAVEYYIENRKTQS